MNTTDHHFPHFYINLEKDQAWIFFDATQMRRIKYYDNHHGKGVHLTSHRVKNGCEIDIADKSITVTRDTMLEFLKIGDKLSLEIITAPKIGIL